MSGEEDKVTHSPDSFKGILSRNLMEMARSMDAVHSHASSVAVGTATREAPVLREELAPVSYIALTPTKDIVVDFPGGISVALRRLATDEGFLSMIADSYDSTLVDYDPKTLDANIKEYLPAQTNAVVTKIDPYIINTVEWSVKSSLTEGHKLDEEIADILTMASITSINQRNAVLGNVGKDEEAFPLKNYFPEYFAQDTKLTAIQDATTREAAELARESFAAPGTEGSPAVRNQEGAQKRQLAEQTSK